MTTKHYTRVGPQFQAVIPTQKYFAGSRPTFARCVNKAKCDGLTRSDVAETAGILIYRCDTLPSEKIDEYMARAEAMTPPYVKFDKTEALQLLHNNNYIIEDALIQLRVNMMNQNRYNENHYLEQMNFNHFN
ncbi:hypothetical protein EDI_096110 [Entamoeba dispar SAW760]|uniref:ELM2 domain-containing protein n=1 Tax=Entamoeba dispar (strain ATCC PRA-260 / SAW760) TaxID=370354 RepID=B0EPP9_ENTDS|nr:uncharacterized protein EDI_096110 [Entamoeba dispar SAW760]EDR23479.1 hypothetical protein EDI_096110 [Entamoeba dispar SAW760]|eukprot:EDR23479.1 hypothetical protein EDI_096110 [Entamoeba dispar SAW760]